eukprot:comp23869_c0_seq1/m.41824 comp23869_c0_seq1/g.41824  ORF comp23869_c0_seq1/g.41824 comp23869_c0_seq1/m.41824 type:complete len:404 (-) comp23869_c0_seq1:202-1413(-)
MLDTANHNDLPPGEGGFFRNHTPIKAFPGSFFEHEPKSNLPHDIHTPANGISGVAEHKPTKRWVRVAKRAKEDFGAQLWCARGKIYVVFVSEFPVSNGTGAGPSMFRSAAYRIGLRFGDEIVSVNEVDTNKLGVLACMDTMKEGNTLDLEICEAALEYPVHIQPTGSLGQHFGITYGGGKIKSVLVDSLAYRSGLQPNYTVISVKGKSAVGKTDEDVVGMLTKALKDREPFVVSVMKARVAHRLTTGIALTVAGMCRNPKFAHTTPTMLIDSDFTLRYVRKLNKHAIRTLGRAGVSVSKPTEGRHTVCEDVSGSSARASNGSARGSIGSASGLGGEGSGRRWSMVSAMMGRGSVMSGMRQRDVVRVTGSAPPRMSVCAPAIPEGEEDSNRNGQSEVPSTNFYL